MFKTSAIRKCCGFKTALFCQTQDLQKYDQGSDPALQQGPPGGSLLNESGQSNYSNMDLFLGNCGGSLGEVSALALLIGGVYLVWKKIISPATPIAFVATVFILALITDQDPVTHIFAGGVMLGAIFMATDYATTPMN